MNEGINNIHEWFHIPVLLDITITGVGHFESSAAVRRRHIIDQARRELFPCFERHTPVPTNLIQVYLLRVTMAC